MKNKLLTTGLASAIALTSVLGLGSSAFAEGGENSSTSNAPTAEQIAAHQANRAEKLEERLSALVEEGKITEAQKDAIIEFFEENKPALDEDATQEEREAAREEFKEALEDFTDENEIDLDLIKPQKGPGGRLSPEDREARQQEHLSGLVEDGTLTQEQADALEQFREENKPDTDPRELTPEERQTQREQMREAFEEFAQENGIDVDDIKPPRGPGGQHGQGGPGSR